MKYLTLLVFLGISLLCEAQQDSIVPFEKAYKRTYNIRKVSGVKPTIDGKLDEDFWTKQGEWSDRFVQIIPYERAITQSPTRVKLFYDDKYIYIGVYCKDAVPDKMNRFIGNRDDNSLGDLISVAFDTYHDYRAAPEFNINLRAGTPFGRAGRILIGRIPVGPPSCVSRSASCAITSNRRMAFGACMYAVSYVGITRCKIGA